MQSARPPPMTVLVAVSILIRPEGRMQPPKRRGRTLSPWLFQSSSGQKAGCNIDPNDRARGLLLVSILIRPEGRMQRPVQERYAHPSHVSILIRPEGRMQPVQALVRPTP